MKIDLLLNARFVFILIYFVLLSCSNKNNEKAERISSADFYKNLFTREIIDRAEFQKFQDSLYLIGFNHNKADSLKTKEMQVIFHFYNFLTSNDSTTQEFKYSIRVGNEYIVREASLEKIGMNVPQRTFLTLDGESVQIGGEQAKPILLNLWFVGCVGCEQEMPSLNKLKEKYADRVDFISVTFDSEKRVTNFLKKREFNFKHIVNVDHDYIKQIGSSPYPENIFIRKEGEIRNIEGGLSEDNNSKLIFIQYLAGILQE